MCAKFNKDRSNKDLKTWQTRASLLCILHEALEVHSRERSDFLGSSSDAAKLGKHKLGSWEPLKFSDQDLHHRAVTTSFLQCSRRTDDLAFYINFPRKHHRVHTECLIPSDHQLLLRWTVK